MLFLTMAQEEPSIRVLTYAPGPLDTEMQLEGRTYTSDPEIQAIFTSKNSLHVLVQEPCTRTSLKYIFHRGSLLQKTSRHRPSENIKEK